MTPFLISVDDVVNPVLFFNSQAAWHGLVGEGDSFEIGNHKGNDMTPFLIFLIRNAAHRFLRVNRVKDFVSRGRSGPECAHGAFCLAGAHSIRS
jgi:hypothetical protein